MVRFFKVISFLVLVLSPGVFAYSQEAGVPKDPLAPAAAVPVDETTLSIDNTPAKAGQTQQENPKFSTFSIWDVIRMVLVLGGVLGVIYLLFFLLKKIGSPTTGDTGSLINIISTKNLTGSSALHLVKIGTQYFLIGASDGGIHLVSEITDKETLDQINLENPSVSSGTKSFSGIIKGLLGGSNNWGRLSGVSNKFLKDQKDRLKNM